MKGQDIITFICENKSNNNKYFYARNFMYLIEYKNWLKFKYIIKEIKMKLVKNNIDIFKHLVKCRRIIKTKRGRKIIDDYILSNIICDYIKINIEKEKENE